ncbi:NAD(P)-binding protein [Auricularia subglabra TFB-10046 SS5]|nr:NAD(P)-binding protein [Auricularia subglabra TFB-10046 SS5]
MSMTYASFAVAGAGALGSLIVSELLKQGARVTVLTRGENTKIPEGATITIVDYTEPEELAAALLLDLVHLPLADAAKAAGVKLFVPSEYGVVSHDLPEGLLSFKPRLHAYLKSIAGTRGRLTFASKSIGLPYTLYYNGLFADLPLFLFPAFDLAQKTLSNVGSDDIKFSATTRSDVAYFVAYTLTHLPPSQLENARLSIEGSKLTWKDIASVFEKKYGGQFTIINRDPARVEKEVQEKGVAAVGDYPLWLFGKCHGNVGHDSNALVPGFTPLSFYQAVEEYYI